MSISMKIDPQATGDQTGIEVDFLVPNDVFRHFQLIVHQVDNKRNGYARDGFDSDAGISAAGQRRPKLI